MQSQLPALSARRQSTTSEQRSSVGPQSMSGNTPQRQMSQLPAPSTLPGQQSQHFRPPQPQTAMPGPSPQPPHQVMPNMSSLTPQQLASLQSLGNAPGGMNPAMLQMARAAGLSIPNSSSHPGSPASGQPTPVPAPNGLSPAQMAQMNFNAFQHQQPGQNRGNMPNLQMLQGMQGMQAMQGGQGMQGMQQGGRPGGINPAMMGGTNGAAGVNGGMFPGMGGMNGMGMPGMGRPPGQMAMAGGGGGTPAGGQGGPMLGGAVNWQEFTV